MIVVDSSVWIDYLRGDQTRAVQFLDEITELSKIIVGDVILLEVLQGARSDAHAERIANELRGFPVVAMCNPQFAVQAASYYRSLRSRGITIRRTVDLVIATYCIVEGHDLLQQDRDFLPFAEHFGLRLL